MDRGHHRHGILVDGRHGGDTLCREWMATGDGGGGSALAGGVGEWIGHWGRDDGIGDGRCWAFSVADPQKLINTAKTNNSVIQRGETTMDTTNNPQS